MKKCVNGKLIEMTKEEFEASKKRFSSRFKQSSESEDKIKKLEETVANLIEELKKLKGQEIPQEVVPEEVSQEV